MHRVGHDDMVSLERSMLKPHSEAQQWQLEGIGVLTQVCPLEPSLLNLAFWWVSSHLVFRLYLECSFRVKENPLLSSPDRWFHAYGCLCT